MRFFNKFVSVASVKRNYLMSNLKAGKGFNRINCFVLPHFAISKLVSGYSFHITLTKLLKLNLILFRRGNVGSEYDGTTIFQILVTGLQQFLLITTYQPTVGNTDANFFLGIEVLG